MLWINCTKYDNGLQPILVSGGDDVTSVPVKQQFEKHRVREAARLSPAAMFTTFRVSEIPFLLHYDAQFELQQVI